MRVDSDSAARNLGEFVDFVSKRPPPAWIFRGQSRVSDPLIPLAQRPGIRPQETELEAFERNLLSQFQREALPYFAQVASELTDWEWLAIAQHHGLPTRLLDWTINAGAALFFAVEDPFAAEDSVVYCYRDCGAHERPKQPFSLDEVAVYHPPLVVGRFIAQRGCFTVHPSDFASNPSWRGELSRVIVPRERRDEIREQLRMLGIDRASLFPGLEGIVSSIRSRSCAEPVVKTAPAHHRGSSRRAQIE